MEPRRILHVVTTMDYGGVETLLMSIYRNIDRSKLQFDFLCHNKTECKFREEILSLGGRIYSIPGPNHGGPLKYQKNLYRFFKSHPEYDIIHSNINIRNGIVLSQAKKAGYAHRISHCHVSGNKHPLPMRLYAAYSKCLDRHSATCRFACSDDAAKYLFGTSDNVRVIRNAINMDRFLFSPEERAELRGKLEIGKDEFVLGHVGRFSDEKNQLFILDVFAEILKYKSDARLLLIGDGYMLEEVKDRARALSVFEKVVFAGQHGNLGPYYSAMDAMIFPSKFEGLGIVAVEAQCSGLKVVASDRVPQAAKVVPEMVFLPLEAPVDIWAKACYEKTERVSSDKATKAIARCGYDIREVANFLQNYYLSLEV